MDWKRLLASITGSVDQDLLLRNEYLGAENRILKNQIEGRLRLTHGEKVWSIDLMTTGAYLQPAAAVPGSRKVKELLFPIPSCYHVDKVLV